MISSMESHCLPFREIPHTTKLFSTFLEDFSRVSRYYAHPPTDQGILAAASEVKFDPETRQEVVAVLREQNRLLGAGRNLDRLAAGAVAIVTGQQVGLFSGPIYSFFKALCAVRFAEEITSRGIDAVPVFWLATEDHDLAEVNHTFWNTRAGLARYELPPREETLNRRVGEIAFGEAIESDSQPSHRDSRRFLCRRSGSLPARIVRAFGNVWVGLRQTDGASAGGAGNHFH